ncbi:hypothetical protein ACJJIU_10170 [Microbulbifer sp. CnH-101-E]|uniref:hypothetical protein n=1 Tax=unclassified Microbulbifer TaxID=2619833 RepID=UPI00403A6F90
MRQTDVLLCALFAQSLRSYLCTKNAQSKPPLRTALCEHMNYYILSKNLYLGQSRLEHADLSMGMVHGRFIQGPGYQKVKSVFKLFASKQYDEYHQKRDDLELTLLDESGNKISTGFIHIEDYSPEFEEISVEVKLVNAQSWAGIENT